MCHYTSFRTTRHEKKKLSEALTSAEINTATQYFFKDGNYFSLPNLYSYILPFLYTCSLQWQLNLHVCFYRTMWRPHRRSMSLQHYLNTYLRITTIKVINTPTPIYCNSLHISFTTANLFNQILITSSFPFFQKYKLQQSLLQNQPKIYGMLNHTLIILWPHFLYCTVFYF